MHLTLTALAESDTVINVDPFTALKHAELVADSTAYGLAPRRMRRPGEARRSFGFAGHNNIFREINLLLRVCGLVNLVLH